MSKKKVAIVDDDFHIRDLLSLYFEKEGFTIRLYEDGEAALEGIPKFDPDIVILDLMLPKKDGFEVCRELQKVINVPIIMLTARGDTIDKIIGLQLGADDYLAKPFEPEELLARVHAVLRRARNSEENKETEEPELVIGNLLINKDAYEVEFNNKRIQMPAKEFELLYYLASHPNKVFTREQLLGHVWGYDFFGESRTVDVHIKRIREKFDELGEHPEWDIKTVWSVGYKFEIEQ